MVRFDPAGLPGPGGDQGDDLSLQLPQPRSGWARSSHLRRSVKRACVTAIAVHVLLRREGWEVNMKRTYRIYKALGLQLRNKTRKRCVKAKFREDRCQASRPHEI